MKTLPLPRARVVWIGLAFLLIALVAPAGAQRIDTRGREFRVAFLPTAGSDRAPRYVLIATAWKATQGTITYVASGKTQQVTIPAGGVPTRIELDVTMLVPADPRTTATSHKSLLASFDDEVSLSAINEQRWSSDAFLCLPVDALGTRHLVLAYPNALDPTSRPLTARKSDFSSQFAVVATQKNTLVTVYAAVPLYGRGMGGFTVTLDAGQVYIWQADGKAGADVSGTEIQSTKPVVVYGGHQRASVPYDSLFGRDHLIEEIPPLDCWETEAIVTPHAGVAGRKIRDSTIVRVISGANGARIVAGNVEKGTLDYGKVMELPLDRPMRISASEPILVAEYHGSSPGLESIRNPEDSTGDPFMTVIQAPSQFDTSYGFESFATADFTHHFVNVIIPTSATAGIRLDGRPLEGAAFMPVPNTSYSFAQVALLDGPHVMTSPVPFGLNAYGYGSYNSYGYTPGVVYRRIPAGVDQRGTAPGAIAMRIVPNTVREMCAYLELEMPYADNVSLALYDPSGRFVRDVAAAYVEAGREAMEIDLNGLTSGIYFVRLESSKGGRGVTEVRVVR